VIKIAHIEKKIEFYLPAVAYALVRAASRLISTQSQGQRRPVRQGALIAVAGDANNSRNPDQMELGAQLDEEVVQGKTKKYRRGQSISAILRNSTVKFRTKRRPAFRENTIKR
jgi:hypothetical protein